MSEQQKTHAGNLATIKRHSTAPPRGQGVILAAPQQGESSALDCAFRRRDPCSSPAHAIARALYLHCCVGGVVDALCVPSDRPPIASNALDTDGRVVGAIRNLWDAIPTGRLELEAWGEDITHARRFRSFRCVLGDLTSATQAVQELAENVLEELWRVGQTAAPPPGPPYAREDSPFELHGHLPAFRVDWWYSVLPALRRDCVQVGQRFHLDHDRPDRWEVALQQELAAVKRRWRRNLSVDAAVLKQLHELAKWCLAFADLIYMAALHKELELPPEIGKDDHRAFEALCRGNLGRYQPELEALSRLHHASVSFGSLTAPNAHAICFEFGRRVLDASHQSQEKLKSLELPGVAQIDAAVQREYDSIRQGSLAIPRNKVAQQRLTFDDETLTITLDGKPFRTADPAAYNIVKFLAHPDRLAKYHPGSTIQATTPGLKGKNKIADKIGSLPKAIRDCIHSAPGRGRCFVLPPKKTKGDK